MLELRDISYEAKVSKRILGQVSVRFKPGSFTAITGPNGSGKSTLAEIIMGIKKPSTGQILFDGQDITEKDITARAKLGIAFSFQQPAKFKGLTAYDLINIASGELIGTTAASDIIREVGLDPVEYLSREVGSKLSGGELKRIEIATILARKDAKYIIFDEPEAGIDLWSFNSLIKIFHKLQKAGKALIVISHQERILKNADRIIILENGKIKASGTPDKIISGMKELES